MKELSIEEKSRRFDEVLAMAKECITYIPDDAVNKYMLNMFPELKESEDEKIKREITGILRNAYWTSNRDRFNELVAWLEKQGESYTKMDVDDAYLEGVTSAKNEMEKQYEANYQIRKDIATFIFNYKGDIKDRAKWMDYLGIKASFVEKQGEQKPNPYSGTSFEYNGHTWGMCARNNGVEILMDSELKAFVSLDKSFIYPIRNQPIIAHKSAMDTTNEENIDNDNNVGPEFHEGDWVIYNKDVCQIVKREEGCNKLVTQFGIEKELVNERNLSTARLWNIQDAKDGDVLVASDGSIFLFAGMMDGYCKYYAALTLLGDDTINREVENGYWETSSSVRLATKEQRDTLMKAMADAGYTFDFEKKELKNIEQKPIIEMKSPEESLGISSEEYNKIVDECIFGKQKPAWSEEDEVKMNRIVACLENLDVADNDILLKDVDWLKSIKERYTWKPSKEQMNVLYEATLEGEPVEALETLLSDLKKL